MEFAPKGLCVTFAMVLAIGLYLETERSRFRDRWEEKEEYVNKILPFLHSWKSTVGEKHDALQQFGLFAILNVEARSDFKRFCTEISRNPSLVCGRGEVHRLYDACKYGLEDIKEWEEKSWFETWWPSAYISVELEFEKLGSRFDAEETATRTFGRNTFSQASNEGLKE